MESDSSPAIKPIKWANVALRFAKTPNPSQQYQHLTSAEPVLLFKSGQTNRRLDQPANPKAGNPSLNSNAGCLKVVDTFRVAKETRWKEKTVSDGMLGIDVSKNTLDVSLSSCNKVRARSFPNSSDGW